MMVTPRRKTTMKPRLILAGKEALEHKDNTSCYILCRSLKMKGFSAIEECNFNGSGCLLLVFFLIRKVNSFKIYCKGLSVVISSYVQGWE